MPLPLGVSYFLDRKKINIAITLKKRREKHKRKKNLKRLIMFRGQRELLIEFLG